jgi:hypothetical protein
MPSFRLEHASRFVIATLANLLFFRAVDRVHFARSLHARSSRHESTVKGKIMFRSIIS